MENLPVYGSLEALSPRVAAIHDISGFGKCSLTVVLPILSAAGLEACALPTAILSTHTGGFTDFTYRDLTDDIMPVYKHWQELGIHFDAAYSGYLGSHAQLGIVSDIYKCMREDGTKIIVDPVMADNGALYALFDESFPLGMRTLCETADIIVPNITEATLMIGEPYREGPYTRDYIEGLLKRLAELPRELVVLTGVHFDENELGAACIDVKTGKIEYAMTQRVAGAYHGTGDIFASVLTAGLMLGKSARAAMQQAADFTAAAVRRTLDAGRNVKYGVYFEAGLKDL